MQVATEIYSSKLSTRIVTPITGDVTSDRFLLSTASIGDENEIHLVEYSTRNRTVYSERIYKHKGQIFGLSSCPYNPELCFAIVGCDSDIKEGYLYRLGNLPFSHASEDKDSEHPESDEIVDVPRDLKLTESMEKEQEGDEKDVKKEQDDEECIPDDKKEIAVVEVPTELTVCTSAPRDGVVSAIWHPGNLEEGSLPHEMIIVYRGGYAGYQISDDGLLNELFYYDFQYDCVAAAWDPLHTHLLALAHDCSITVMNISDNTVYADIHRAHGLAVTCVDYNPNRPSTLCSGGKDGVINIWHVSHHGISLEKSIQAHSHWVTSVHYNPLHDQLLLSSSTDSSISLWRLFSVSSDRIREKQQEDKLVVSLGGTRESVYSCCWSAKNMWLFGGASYEGKLLFGFVPSDEVAVLLDEI